MIMIKLSELQEQTINSLIDENQRFTIILDEEESFEEGDKTKDVTDKVALFREQYLRGLK